MAENKEELKILLMKVKEESEKAGLKLIIQKIKFTASGPTASWWINGEIMETVTDFTILGYQIPLDGDCSHEIKRYLLVGRKAMTNLDCVLTSRDITLPTKFLIIRAIGFPVVMYGCESWPLKKAKCWRICDVWTVVLEKTLESPWDRREIRPVNSKRNQPWIFIEKYDAKAAAPILWPLDVKCQLIGSL